jgi:hypothetical protein
MQHMAARRSPCVVNLRARFRSASARRADSPPRARSLLDGPYAASATSGVDVCGTSFKTPARGATFTQSGCSWRSDGLHRTGRARAGRPPGGPPIFDSGGTRDAGPRQRRCPCRPRAGRVPGMSRAGRLRRELRPDRRRVRARRVHAAARDASPAVAVRRFPDTCSAGGPWGMTRARAPRPPQRGPARVVGGACSPVANGHQPADLVRPLERALEDLADSPHVVLRVEHAGLERGPLVRLERLREVPVGSLDR